MELFRPPSKERLITLALFGSAGFLAARLKTGLIYQILLALALGLLLDFLRKRAGRYFSSRAGRNRDK